MARWSDYTTGERIEILRGPGLTQERLAEACGLSVTTIRKAERDLGVGLPSLLRISAALHTDVSVNGTAFGPATVKAQAVGIQVSTGRPARALETYAAIGDQSILTPRPATG